ncbi:hypothetical protein [Novosphingobium jiangmenense]|uniref:Uncharacterized protein n=1 Tax=Novosphingobium jiangmenense TaxID=2791981 RepID=A0ABS0HIZ4_9SPHN|nr:hypothetical protein [Novosphingobium jiangmenense]MBF9152224.1 hypothetical protein [Novosphingobium jiangmenense]
MPAQKFFDADKAGLRSLEMQESKMVRDERPVDLRPYTARSRKLWNMRGDPQSAGRSSRVDREMAKRRSQQPRRMPALGHVQSKVVAPAMRHEQVGMKIGALQDRKIAEDLSDDHSPADLPTCG